MTTLEDEVRSALQAKARSLPVPQRPALDRDVAPNRHPRSRWLIAAAACLALLVAGLVSYARKGADDPATVASGPDVTRAEVTNGWVAFTRAAGQPPIFEIYLVRPGEDPRRLDVAGPDATSDACPAWSPDGTRLMFGRLTGSSSDAFDAELVIVPVTRDGTAGAPTVIPLAGFDAPEASFFHHPCGTWASDGRWVALRGPGQVWVVDAQTSEIRRLPNLRPVDLEWRPGTDQLAIAGDVDPRNGEARSTPVTVYSASTGELRQLGSVQAGNLTWSPDGSTLAFTPTDDEDDASGLWLVDADGTDERLLVADTGDANHGSGPVWSPAGDRIAYQRLCCGPGRETHEVVLVRTSDGTETVIEPPKAEGMDEVRWYPYTVSWSPDGEALLYSAWRALSVPAELQVDGRAHVITVSPDAPYDVTVLALGGNESHTDQQVWAREPG